MRRLLLIGILAASPAAARAEEPTADELAKCFRQLLLPSLPNPLVEQSFNWGHQEMVTVGIKWNNKGPIVKPESIKKLHNDGHWKKVIVAADNPEKRLEVRVKDVKMAEPGRLTFAMAVHLPVRVTFDQQIWRKGTRLYSGETRARAWTILELQCESTSRFESKPGALIPELVMRFRVLDARLRYYDLVVEHTAGVGGDLAKLLGETMHDLLRAWKPSLEKDLLAKANQAIIKAGDTKEIRLGFGKLFGP
jgi:hypothetical protein